MPTTVDPPRSPQHRPGTDRMRVGRVLFARDAEGGAATRARCAAPRRAGPRSDRRHPPAAIAGPRRPPAPAHRRGRGRRARRDELRSDASRAAARDRRPRRAHRRPVRASRAALDRAPGRPDRGRRICRPKARPADPSSGEPSATRTGPAPPVRTTSNRRLLDPSRAPGVLTPAGRLHRHLRRIAYQHLLPLVGTSGPDYPRNASS